MQGERERTTTVRPRPLGVVNTWWIRLGFAVVAAGTVALLARRVNWTLAKGDLGQLGVDAPLALLPYLFVVVGDTLGWRRTFERPQWPKVGVLWRIRIATEAVAASVPAGVAVAEPLRVLLLERLLGMSIATATANVVVTKLAMAFAQGAFLACGIGMAISSMEAQSPSHLGGSSTAWLGLAGAVALLVTMGGGLLLLSRGRILSRVLGAVEQTTRAGHPWRPRLARLAGPFERLDHGFAVLWRVPRTQVAAALAWFLVAWACLGFETWLILALLKSRVSFAMSVSIEGAVSLVRMGFFFLPAGLGAQEMGYYELLKVAGVANPEATAAAFLVVKRAKELFWIALGYLVLLSLPARIREVTTKSEGS